MPPFELGDLLTQPRAWCESAIRERSHGATLGNGAALCRVLGRYRMFVDKADLAQSAGLVLDGFKELPVVAALVGCVRRGANVVDVGTGLGYYALLLGDLAGTGGHVIAFEPDPQLARRARDSIGVNGFAGTTTLHEVALGTAGARGLDSFPEALAAEVIRIDANGREQQVWRGMTGLLARGGPLTVFLRFHGELYPDPAGFLGEIAGEGFTVEAVGAEIAAAPVPQEAGGVSRNGSRMLRLSR